MRSLSVETAFVFSIANCRRDRRIIYQNSNRDAAIRRRGGAATMLTRFIIASNRYASPAVSRMNFPVRCRFRRYFETLFSGNEF